MLLVNHNAHPSPVAFVRKGNNEISLSNDHTFISHYPITVKDVYVLTDTDVRVNQGISEFNSFDYRVDNGLVEGVEEHSAGIINSSTVFSNERAPVNKSFRAVYGIGIFTSCVFIRHLDKCRRKHNFLDRGVCVDSVHGNWPTAEWSFHFQSVPCEMRSDKIFVHDGLAAYNGSSFTTGHSTSVWAKFQRLKRNVAAAIATTGLLHELGEVVLGGLFPLAPVMDLFSAGSSELDSALDSLIAMSKKNKYAQFILDQPNLISTNSAKLLDMRDPANAIPFMIYHPRDCITGRFGKIITLPDFQLVLENNKIKLQDLDGTSSFFLESESSIVAVRVNDRTYELFIHVRHDLEDITFVYAQALTVDLESLGYEEQFLFGKEAYLETDPVEFYSSNASEILSIIRKRMQPGAIATVQGQLYYNVPVTETTATLDPITTSVAIENPDNQDSMVHHNFKWLTALIGSYIGYFK